MGLADSESVGEPKSRTISVYCLRSKVAPGTVLSAASSIFLVGDNLVFHAADGSQTAGIVTSAGGVFVRFQFDSIELEARRWKAGDASFPTTAGRTLWTVYDSRG
jgi:hypothetical protein